MKITVPHKVLAALSAFISSDETRYVLNGVSILARKGRAIELAATDGRRLAVLKLKDQLSERDFQVIMPSSAIEAAKACFSDFNALPITITYDPATGIVSLSQDDSAGGVRITITQRRIEGTYPTYEMVIPNPLPTEWAPNEQVAYNGQFWADCMKIADQVSPRSQACKIGRRADDGVLVLTCDNSPDLGLTCVMMPMRA